MKLKQSKFEFMQPEINYLGHIVSPNGIMPEPSKASALNNLHIPKMVKDVRSFIGLASYYLGFAPKFLDIVKPSTSLTRKHAHFEWTSLCQEALDKLKMTLAEGPALSYPIMDKP